MLGMGLGLTRADLEVDFDSFQSRDSRSDGPINPATSGGLFAGF